MTGSIILIGPMGSGKSTIGRLLATRLHLPYVDSDALIVSHTGVDIPTIFEIEGESGFRERERKVIADLATQSEAIVLATGGGAILDPANRRHLRRMGKVIYLDVSVDEQLKRIRHDRNRPLLQNTDLDSRLQTLAEQRHTLYQETAHWRVLGDGLRSDQVLRRILRHLQPRSGQIPARG
ncbi:Shikimate kinase [Acidithiobacillus ferrivorans SS3]|uniref:Shikimate kinase n=2 Tax=Acidithiobacillus ferrivorans TaxID=160808 RepID=G0JN64_9PROT|nr:shikimate kinase [Acidithiobacillus ferrivorans]AEM48278.1 Shikimate kinase [Acidithiobacillus ferrivorans SS3]MBU2768332.1 shikimate kinase [Acidithiobacillus ferrivorans]MBU2852233.1 shikimate kinase [Acidithiobacillus ferrivorans]OFA17133.1 shikimate kinase [Acidithiobacillus ferrivorans]